MKKTILRATTMVMVVVLCLLVSVPAFASDAKEIVPLNPEDVIEFSEVLTPMPNIVLGTPDMAEFDNSPNIRTRASGFLFSMRAAEVHELLITGSEKVFFEDDLDNGYLYISGKLEHTIYSGARMKIGGCWYRAVTGTYEADLYDYVFPGSISSRIDIPKYEFAKDREHRGFVKNLAGGGYLSGNLYFYSEE